jgi:hypothetical protein
MTRIKWMEVFWGVGGQDPTAWAVPLNSIRLIRSFLMHPIEPLA